MESILCFPRSVNTQQKSDEHPNLNAGTAEVRQRSQDRRHVVALPIASDVEELVVALNEAYPLGAGD